MIKRKARWIALGLVGFVLVLAAIFFAAGLEAACITLVIGGILAIQSWVASYGPAALQMKANVLMGPPDGG